MDIIKEAKEVLQIEADAILSLKSQINENFEKAVKRIFDCKGKVIVTAVGKSGHIGRKIAATLASTGTSAFFVHPTEAYHGDLGMITDNDVVLAISNSGSSIEIVNIIPVIKKIGAGIISITSNMDSVLAKHSEISLLVKVDKEADGLNIAPTASTTAVLAFGDALAVALLKLRDFNHENFALYHPGGFLGRMLLKVKDIMIIGEQNSVINRNVSLKEAIIKSSENNLGAITIVDEEGKVVGIVTDGDVRRLLKQYEADELASVLSQSVSNYMIKNPLSIREDEFCQQAVALMEEKNTYVLPVTGIDNKAVGMIRMHDLVKQGFTLNID